MKCKRHKAFRPVKDKTKNSNESVQFYSKTYAKILAKSSWDTVPLTVKFGVYIALPWRLLVWLPWQQLFSWVAELSDKLVVQSGASKPCNARTERVGIEALVNNRARNAAAGDINRALFIARAESGGKRPLFGPVNQILNRCDRERVWGCVRRNTAVIS